MTTASAHAPRELTAEQTASVRQELDALLSGEQFSGTVRCHDFLKFVVNSALAGDYANLTERALGAEIFGRPIDYETGIDAIVRVRANDVRRRLIQHYSGPHPASRVRINLPSGSYIPEFDWTTLEHASPMADEPGAPIQSEIDKPKNPASKTAAPGSARKLVLKRSLWLTVALLLVLGACFALFVRNSEPPRSELQRFWQPMIQERGPVIVCLGNAVSFWPSQSVRQAIVDGGNDSLLANPGPITMTRDDTVTAGNLRAALSVVNVLHAYGVANQLRWPQEVQSADLDQSSVVFIGGFNNPWSVRLNAGLRFSFKEDRSASKFVWMIQDQTSPNETWSLANAYPEPIKTDYALITRIVDRGGKRVVVSAGGLSQFGTEAAGEFLSNENEMRAFAMSAPKGWENRNVQIVLQLEVDGRKIVDPRIVATNIW